ncbi:MAG: HAMP domain-containing protein [Anaerolineae bacterium]|nr:HAMP domain-containing protein [Anaerolineae bacterium]
MHSLWTKLMGAFVLVILVGTGMVVFLMSQTTANQFELYITQTGQQQAVQLAPVAADYYTRSGSWNGIDAALRNPWGYRMASGNMGNGMVDSDMMMGDMGGWSGHDTNESDMMDDMGIIFSDRILLAQADGTVVVDTAGTLLGGYLQTDDLAKGAPIMAGGQLIGTLIITPLDAPATPAGDFLGAVNRSALFAGVAAGSLALILGSVLFVQMIRPLRRLSTAAQGIAAGDLSQRVQISSHDEISQVSATFNHMAETLQCYAVERRNMIGDIAHDLRTPLSIIQSNLEAMLDGVLPTTPEELTSLHQETLHLNRLITDLRTLSLAEAGQLQLQKQSIEPGSLVQQVSDRMHLSAEEKNITLETDIASDLPPVQADPERLTQVMTNLVDNAIRYNPNGSRVIVAAHPANGHIELSVTDNGPGIAPEDIPHLFERFWRAEKSRNRATGGSGLGLAIVKQLVEAHHGEVQVESQIGNGTRFMVLLPVA